MKKKALFLMILVFLLSSANFLYAKDVSFTQEDRERLIRLEEGLKATNQRIDDLRDLIYVVIGGIIALIGFVIWDRRTALAPAIRKNKELEEREEIIEKALREYAKVEPRLAEILKSLRLM